MDPWLVAIVTIIIVSVRSGRGIPTYTTLLHEAAGFIGEQIREKKIKGKKYLGPSDDRRNPVEMNYHTGASHQDPQLSFSSTYGDPDVERFLCPLVGPTEDWDDGTVKTFQNESPSMVEIHDT